MRWKKLFIPVENMDAAETREYLQDHKEGTYTLLDVRQPKEYEQSHIPGAKLIPVAQLSDRLEELDRKKPVVVYCAVGGRSRAAAQLLAGKDFDEVYNVKGGIKAWEGRTAETPVDLEALELTGDETVSDIIILIYAMEAGLESFYKKAAQDAVEKKVKDLLQKLAGIEIRHKEKLHNLFISLNPDKDELTRFEESAASVIMEGGFDMETFLAGNKAAMQSAEGVLDIAMMLETHGLDLYLRYAQETRTEDSRKVLLDLAEEEKAHLRALGDLLDSL